eukprot:TRINITY_DN78369_c0_g1_i1.p1 TRINITY_DN78369_c0_g1~~TRINITY_DN78369_c0_g1_i1.p1  ORF type:complete len:1580 (+),score=330.12 TRINITY_DN78369_c0_g1_i1:136-4875(+)
MAPDHQEAVEQPQHSDQTADPQRDSAQPDMDPGVIDVDDESIDVEDVEEEEDAHNSFSEENGNVVDLVSPRSRAEAQTHVDVIDLEEADEDGEEEGEEEEGITAHDLVPDDIDEDTSRSPENEKHDEKESVLAEKASQNGVDAAGKPSEQHAEQVMTTKETDQEQLGKASDSDQKQLSEHVAGTDAGLEKPMAASSNVKESAGEMEQLSAVAPSRPEGDRSEQQLNTQRQDPKRDDPYKPHTSPQGYIENEQRDEHVQTGENKLTMTEEASQPLPLAESGQMAVDESVTDAHGDGVSTSENMPKAVPAPAVDTTNSLAPEHPNESSDKAVVHPKPDMDEAAPEPISNEVDVETSGKIETDATKDKALMAMVPLNEASVVETSATKPEDTMDLDNVEEEGNEDAMEDEPEHIEDDNENADMELSEEEPAHELRAGGDEESEPLTTTAQRVRESLTPGADHKSAEFFGAKDSKQDVLNFETQVESTSRVGTDDEPKSRGEQNSSQAPSKDEEGKASDLAVQPKVQLPSTAKAECTNDSKLLESEVHVAAPANLSVDEAKTLSVSPPREGQEAENVASEAADGRGGSPSANLTAPLFGMRPSGFPAQPVSFRTPPSFQRTSLSPNARPFIPAAHREAMRMAALRSVFQKDETAPAEVLATSEKETVKKSVTSEPEAKAQQENKLLFSPQQSAVPLQPKSDPVPQQEDVPTQPTSQTADVQGAKQSMTKKSVITSGRDELTSAVQPPPSSNESKVISAKKAPALKVKRDAITKPDSKPHGKRVTFSLSQTKEFDSSEPQTAASHSESLAVASESEHGGRAEEQKLKEEHSDDGFIFEVSHVPVSVRIGTGNVIKRGSLSTLRLTVVNNGESKLDMFKEGASSLSLFESLSVSRNVLRVRKVSNRPVMTVALMSNNNGGTQVAKKYYVHLGHHLYDKVFKACVAHLNSTGPDKRSGIDSAPSATLATKRSSTPLGSDGEDIHAIRMKRSADTTRSADPTKNKAAERRRKLLETKAKLLENLKAARKNKAGTGAGEKDQGPPDKMASGTANLLVISGPGSKAKPAVHGAPRASLQNDPKVEVQKPASTFGAGNALNQGSSTTSEAAVQTPLAAVEKRNLLADTQVQSARQKDVSGDKMQTDSVQKVAPSGSSLKRKKPVGSMAAPHYGHGKRALDLAKSTDTKRQRIGNEKNVSVVGAPGSAHDKLKALRDQIKTPGRGVSAKNMVSGVATATKSTALTPSFEDVEEVKRIRSMVANLTTEREEIKKRVALLEEQKKKMEEDFDQLQKQLSKAKSETEESKSEAARLKEESKAAERNMAETVALLQKSGQELKELWNKVSDMLEVVKAAEEAEKVDDENEEERKISLSRCDHDSVQDFFYRLRSFKASTWPVEEEDIGALACARHGWYNTGVNELKSSEGVTLVLGDLFESADSYEQKVEEMKIALVQKHALLSGWRGKQCARDIGKELLSKERLESNVTKLRSCAAMKRVRGFESTSRGLCELVAACGWRATEGSVRCEWCGMEVNEVHLRESHLGYCLLAREEGEVRRNVELLGLDWEVEGARLGYFFRSSYGDATGDMMEVG